MKTLFVLFTIFSLAVAAKLGCIEGVMGSGKSTLLKNIPHVLQINGKLFTIAVVPEPYTQFETSGLLDVYSAHYQKMNFEMQLAIYSALLAQFIDKQHSLAEKDLILFDRCPRTALDIYIHTVELSPAEVEMVRVYKHLMTTHLRTWKKMDFHIYLNVSAETAFDRIRQRNRSIGETMIPKEYIQKLLDLFKPWAANVHVLDDNSWAAVKPVLEKIVQK